MIAEVLLQLLFPFLLILGRVAAFMAVLPLFSGPSIPNVVRVGIVLVLTVFMGMLHPSAGISWADTNWLAAIVMMVQEILCGLALGLAAHLVFLSVQQGARIMSQQMGFSDAGIIDPSTGEPTESMSMVFEMAFALLFLAANGHHLLLGIIDRSYDVFPVAGTPSAGVMAQALVTAGQSMLLFALKLAAPMLAAFLVLGVVLALLARVLPEINILMASYPLRVGMGLFLAMAILPFMAGMTEELGEWLARRLI